MLAAYHEREECRAFSRDEARRTVIPIYMGMIRQIDDEIGRLMTFLEERGELDDMMIVFTSDHGDYLGDHWLGDKEMFHRQSTRIPLIVVDPGTAADATRGTVSNRPVEAIDLLPTFVDWLGEEVPEHILEGRSLLPLLHGRDVAWRKAIFSELDYSFRQQRRELDIPPHAARAYNLRDARWNYVYFEGFPSQLFDLQNDPDEFIDLGRDPAHAEVRGRARGPALRLAARAQASLDHLRHGDRSEDRKLAQERRLRRRLEPGGPAMIVDVRRYTLKPGHLAPYLSRYGAAGYPVQAQHLGPALGWFIADVGPQNHVLHIWGYDDSADMEARRAAMAARPRLA